ncbi:Holliday junction branch migration protein RuvA [Fusobacterium simiae]|uniref:Holliday junction branch migration complex subunit RuvA n=1 Tax=Fusobacterium simiae TaxID=855 RepID=A0ABT4DI04_FUSSI|nr:Holliday junction branch migration protein RuvA [Fusobacterium simiae]MCY7007116.1 Holliday junction branch migration protein RuvA [Fusobacterium simiae]
MFEYLYGTVEYKKMDYIAIDINGVGYKIYFPLREYEKIEVGNKYKFYIYNYIKEDNYKLIGFLEEKDRKIYEQLLKIDGIGPSLSLAVLSNFSYNKIIEIISKNDYTTLRQVPKLGEKKAQIIILNLKSKLKNLTYTEEETISMDMLEDLVLALEGLGYSKKEIDKTLSKVDLSVFSSLEDAIKGILKNMRIGE